MRLKYEDFPGIGKRLQQLPVSNVYNSVFS